MAAPGQRLIEADITREIGASRSRIRDAFRRLEAEGLIVVEAFRGASVRRHSRSDIRELYRARMALEGMAAHDFAVEGTAGEKAALQTIQRDLDIAAAAGDHMAFARCNDAWHHAIIAGGHNAYVGRFLEYLRVPVYRLLFTSFYNSERIRMANTSHQRVTAAIISEDGPGAEAAMRAHIAEGLEALSGLMAASD
ncbi:hypothetical protein GCM10011380_12130 [Sphingomonas metalli]|uniref:HTH gntR-type domain-containing protein n=2 Tax=Sphingomonas metalli TaxID=1779358 RepID=A0A916SZ18_9SPHN|nr:hypothetical protein GCM10011380_12130 [Sphingomonas metalli]